MTDTATLRSRIADELNRAPSQIIGAGSLSVGYIINREINAALKHYESMRTWFMEFKDWKFATTISGERYYSLSANFMRFDSVKYVFSSSWETLTEKTWAEIEDRDRTVTGSLGLPRDYVLYANTLRLFPVPNGAYSLVGSGIRRPLLTSLTGSFTATNSHTPTSTASHNNRIGDWYEHGADLIRARAKASFEINYLRKPAAIAEMEMIFARGETYFSLPERIASSALADETAETVARGKIRPYLI